MPAARRRSWHTGPSPSFCNSRPALLSFSHGATLSAVRHLPRRRSPAKVPAAMLRSQPAPPRRRQQGMARNPAAPTAVKAVLKLLPRTTYTSSRRRPLKPRSRASASAPCASQRCFS
ncbi:unnamed protein product [Prorocentrum cordatum]|uniref:Uncharacterized protein n=1 Tax=Prorocentrum cordatum TaxID=2364126 RepID=A0ABN9PYL4_9DINO|nr:unnamed protein product [Polarella glacialis]